jgi:4,5:9,10-diseco-3-hydroxy-5,9,17-trioxoandrosta-1(10),2-diene-4-oate hydrolase
MDGNSLQTLMLEVSGTKLAVTRQGTGPALVCLHAIGHGARDFARLGERLGRRFTTVAIDFPGHGGSPKEETAPSPARYAELLAGAVDALGLTRFALLGNSIGGAAALRYAAANPERVRALVLCNSGGLQKVGLLAQLYCGAMARFFAKGARGDKSFARKYRRYYERTVLTGAKSAWRREEIIAEAAKSAPLLAAAWRGFARPSADLRHLPQTLQCPVLYAWAKGDRAIAWRRSKRAALSAPNATVALLDGGHAAFLEAPEAFDAALTAFLGKAS